MRYFDLILAGTIMATSSAAWAIPGLSITSPDSTTVMAGQSFTITLKLTGVTSADQVAGVNVALQQSAGPTANVLTVTGWDHTQTPFTDLNTMDPAQILSKPIPNAVPMADIGGLTPASSAVGAGDYTLAVLTVQSSNLAQAGSYTIKTSKYANWTYSPPQFLEGSGLSATYDFTVAVPEPASIGAMLTATGLLPVRFKRQGE